METFEWNARTIVTVAVAFLLAASVGAMGVWLLLSGQPGTGMMERDAQAGMMGDNDHAGMVGTAMPGHMMGAPADRGVFGGYTGLVGLVMILAFIAMIGLLLYALLRERPGQPQPAACWNCARPVESDWTACPYCGVGLAEGGRPPQIAEAR